MSDDEIEQSGEAFKARVRDTFAFVVTDLGFEPMADESDYCVHRLVFHHRVQGLEIHVTNAYQRSYEHGFVLDLVWTGRDWECAYALEKKGEDPGFSFLLEAAKALRLKLQEHGLVPEAVLRAWARSDDSGRTALHDPQP